VRFSAIKVQNQGVPKQGIEDQRHPDHAGQEPERNFWKIPPQWQVPTIIYVERGEHENEGRAHAGEM